MSYLNMISHKIFNSLTFNEIDSIHQPLNRLSIQDNYIQINLLEDCYLTISIITIVLINKHMITYDNNGFN